VFPRWFGYFQFCAAIGFAPTGFVLFTQEGPFAWNGLISFWVALTFAFAWLVVTTHVTAGAIRHGGDSGTTGVETRLAALEARLETR
jgi:hypothetical protein